ncbi:MAG: glycosyltransferase family 4 protein [Sciscionella sp.]
MKVVLVTRLFAPEVAAAAFRLRALADGLADAGHQVVVLTTRPPKNAVADMAADYGVRRWPVLRDAGGTVRGYVQYASYDLPLLVRLMFRSADAVVSEPPPTTGLVTAAVCCMRRTPFFYYAADIWSDALAATETPKSIITVMRAIERFVLGRARGVIAVSDGVAERVAELGSPRQRIEVVPNGVDTSVFHPTEPVHVTGGRYFSYTGTMSEWQGADVFIRALQIVLKTHPDVRLKFFGQGSAEPELRRLAERLTPHNVDFGGVVPPTEAAGWLSGAIGALVSIVPGQGYDFAKPTKIYAAAACGTPVLFAGVGDSAALVQNQRLGLVAEYSPEDVARQLLAMLENDQVEGQHLVDWVKNNASLATTGRLAAQWISAEMGAHTPMVR